MAKSASGILFAFLRLLPPVAPDFSLLRTLVTDSFAIAIVGFSMGISLAKIFALKHNYSVDSNQVRKAEAGLTCDMKLCQQKGFRGSVRKKLKKTCRTGLCIGMIFFKWVIGLVLFIYFI